MASAASRGHTSDGNRGGRPVRSRSGAGFKREISLPFDTRYATRAKPARRPGGRTDVRRRGARIHLARQGDLHDPLPPPPCRRHAVALLIGLGTATFAAAATGPVTAAESDGGSGSQAPEIETLSGEDIESTLIGNTVVGVMDDGHDYVEYYVQGGLILAEDYMAQWSIEDDRMCFDYSRADKTCFGVGLQRGEVVWMQDGEAVGKGHILDGNAYGFDNR